LSVGEYPRSDRVISRRREHLIDARASERALWQSGRFSRYVKIRDTQETRETGRRRLRSSYARRTRESRYPQPGDDRSKVQRKMAARYRRTDATHNLCTLCREFVITKESRRELINSAKLEKGTPESIRAGSTLSAYSTVSILRLSFFPVISFSSYRRDARKLFDLYRATFVRIS